MAADNLPAGLRGLIDAAVQHAPTFAKARRDHTVGMLEQFEADIGPLVAPIAQKLLDDPTLPEELRPLLEAASAPQHFGESVVIGIVIGSILGPVLSAAFQPSVQALANSAWSFSVRDKPHGGTVPPTPDLLAAATLKTVIDEQHAAIRAAESGVSVGDFDLMYQTAGQSIGLEEALLLERRNQWVGVTIDDALAYGNLNKRFYESAKNLKFAPPPAGEVISGVLKHHLPEQTARTYLSYAGIDPDTHYDWMVATAGRPPGIEQIIHLWNLATSGVLATGVDESVVDAAVEQSDINDAYLPYVKMLRHYFPPPRSIVPMIRAGAINDTQAGQLLDAYGVGEPWKSAFIAEGHTTKSSAAKELTVSQVLRLHTDGFLNDQDATTRLEALKYPADQIALLLELGKNSAVEKLQTTLMSTARSLYTAHKIDKPTATTMLTNGNIPGAAITQAFAYWDLERAAKVHVPTPAQIVGAFRRGEITAADTKTRLLELGVQPGDLAIIVADGWPPTQGPTATKMAAEVVAA